MSDAEVGRVQSESALPWTMMTQGWFKRWVAGGVIDFLVVTVPYALLTGFSGFLVDWLIRGRDHPLGARDPSTTFLQFVGWGLALLLYFVVFELLFATTPGKRLFGMRVVAMDGSQPPAGSVIVRNLFKVLVLMLPMLQLVTLLTVDLRDDDRRLGDLIAGTCVVCEEALADRRPTSASGRPAPKL
jgi:uncharacterized RDD family membrane protein YckC